MISLVKVVIPCVLGVGSAGLIGSNWVFKKEKLVDVKEETEWTEKLKKLAKKLEVESTRNSISEKIAGNSEKSKLALNTGNKTFSNVNDAKGVLQKWCANPTNGQEYVNELCKKTERRNWLFG